MNPVLQTHKLWQCYYVCFKYSSLQPSEDIQAGHRVFFFSFSETQQENALLQMNIFLQNESVSCSVMSNSLQPHGLAPQTPLSMEFSRQEYWRGLLCPPPEDPPDPEIEPASPAAMALKVDSVQLSHQGSHHPCHIYICTQIFMLQTGEN